LQLETDEVIAKELVYLFVLGPMGGVGAFNSKRMLHSEGSSGPVNTEHRRQMKV
jgi:hypothetical protein